tara:strand:- start:732 stop:1355 length:624 start_codon:yes stop_codon:yes gene_type:complete
MDKILPGEWTDYYKVQYDNPTRKTLLKGLEYFENHNIDLSKVSVDIGCGQGSDIKELLNRKWKVIGIDKEQEAIDILEERFVDYIGNHLNVIKSKMDSISIPSTSLINASYSLPFCSPNNFSDLWARIDSSLPINGIFCGQFFGVNDSWANNPQMIFHNDKQVKSLFSNYSFIYYREIEEDSTTALNTEKHWHVFHVTAIKKEKREL